MTKKFALAALAAVTLTGAAHAGAVTITFDEPGIAPGTPITDQYAALGAIFSANAFSGSGSSFSGKPWATNTDMTVAASVGGDVSTLGTPTPGTTAVSGNLLHAYSGYLKEDGDGSFRITFTRPVSDFSATFAGVTDLADTRVYFYDGTTQLAVMTGALLSPKPAFAQNQFVLSGAFASITSVVVMPGSYIDWVGVDNITFTPSAVPEAASWATMALGIGALAFLRRTR